MHLRRPAPDSPALSPTATTPGRRLRLLAVIASALSWRSASCGDPLIGLAITLVILRITWQSWRTVRGHDHHH